MTHRRRRASPTPSAPGRCVRISARAVTRALAFVLLAASGARAAEPAQRQSAARGLVRLELRASEADSSVLRETVGELCARVGLAVREPPWASDEATGELVVGEVSIDLGATPGTIVVRAGRRGRVVLQRSLAMEGPRPVLLESAATIAYTALEALLPGSERDVARLAAPVEGGAVHRPGIDAVVAVGAAAAAPPPRFGMELAPLALVRVGDSAPGPAWGGGLRVGGGWRKVPLEPSFSVTGAVRRSTPAGGFATGAADLHTYSLRLSVGVAVASGARVGLQTGPSFAIETTSAGGPVGGMPSMNANPVLRAGWEGRVFVGLASHVQAFLGAGGDCALDRATSSPPAAGPPPPGGPAPGGPPPFPQAGGVRPCGLTTELGVAFTLFGAPVLRTR